MDTTLLMLSFLFGIVGTGFLMYGKKAGAPVAMGTGLALMVCPYFIPNAGVLLTVCLGLSAAPFLLRE